MFQMYICTYASVTWIYQVVTTRKNIIPEINIKTSYQQVVDVRLNPGLYTSILPHWVATQKNNIDRSQPSIQRRNPEEQHWKESAFHIESQPRRTTSTRVSLPHWVATHKNNIDRSQPYTLSSNTEQLRPDLVFHTKSQHRITASGGFSL
jgi:hypothetical protein